MDAYTLVSDEVWSEEDLRCSESGLANLVEKKYILEYSKLFSLSSKCKINDKNG